jgi:hypothetical protein
MMSVIILNVVMLNVVMLNVGMLSVIILNVVAPNNTLTHLFAGFEGPIFSKLFLRKSYA